MFVVGVHRRGHKKTTLMGLNILEKLVLFFFRVLTTFLWLKCTEVFYLLVWSLEGKLENFKYSRKAGVHIPQKRLNPMPSAKLVSSRDPVILPWLARELEKEIPDLDIYGSERRLLDFAYQDLETSLTEKLSTANFVDIDEPLNDESRQEEIKAFLKIWTKPWLGKWRERVTFCQRMPQFSLEHLKTKKKATKIFEHMENGQELKQMVVQRLINYGEVCMPELIAENLIIEEIAFRLKMNEGKISKDKTMFDSWSIFQEVSPRVKSLAERKTPLIHLRLMTDV
jgi:hypothetical protein